MNNKQTAKAWATQSKKSGKGNNFFFKGAVLYSYGYHFEVAVIQDGKAYFNTAKYSRSTTRHQSIARQAAIRAGLECVEGLP
jgi:hypothetical protein